MPSKPTEFGIKFKQMFSYSGKLTYKDMGPFLWNEYCKLKIKERTHSEEHIKLIQERRKLRHLETLKKRSERVYHNYKNADITKIRNYQLAKADNYKGWQLHHILETHNLDGSEKLIKQSIKELMKQHKYYEATSDELIFMKTADHRILHRAKSRKLLDYINFKYFNTNTEL